jgi:type II secretory pathway component PulF
MIYTYEAKDETGKTISGTLEADTEQSAAALIRNMGFFPMRFATVGRFGNVATLDNRPLAPTRLTDRTLPSSTGRTFQKPFAQKAYGSWFARTLVYPVYTGVTAKDLSIFFREFAAMLQAGVPITRCLQAIGESRRVGPLTNAIRRIKMRVEAGDSLSNAFGEFPHLFSDLNRAMIAAGEESGGLDIILLRVSDYLENEFVLREMVKRETFSAKINAVGALFLPPLFIWVTQGWGPYYHQIVQPVLDFGILGIFAFYGLRVAFQNATVAYAWDTLKAFTPGFGGMIRMLALAKFARALSALYTAGVLIPRAMTISANVTGNAYLSRKIGTARDAMMNGATMAQSFANTGVFPPIFLSMVHTGETTGSVDTMLSKVADFYEDEAKTKIHNVVKTIPVLLLLFMGVWVGIEAMKMMGGYIGDLNSIMDSNG